MSKQTILVAAAALTLAATPTLARSRVHHHHVTRAIAPYAPPTGGYYGVGGYEGDIIARRTAEAYREPGVTLELAPDAKQTATGGPSGGVPGFSSD